MNIFSAIFNAFRDTPPEQLRRERILSEPLISAGHEAFERRLMKETGWPLDKTRRVITEYRHFMLSCLSGDRIPTEDVDKCWHSHITWTEEYFGRWSKIMGKVIHHKPEIPKEVVKTKLQDQIRVPSARPVQRVATPKKEEPSRSYNQNDDLLMWPLYFGASDTSHKCADSTPSHSHHDSSPSHSHDCGGYSSHSCSSSSCSSSSCSSGGGGD